MEELLKQKEALKEKIRIEKDEAKKIKLQEALKGVNQKIKAEEEKVAEENKGKLNETPEEKTKEPAATTPEKPAKIDKKVEKTLQDQVNILSAANDILSKENKKLKVDLEKANLSNAKKFKGTKVECQKAIQNAVLACQAWATGKSMSKLRKLRAVGQLQDIQRKFIDPIEE